jgi:hypothetical protein
VLAIREPYDALSDAIIKLFDYFIAMTGNRLPPRTVL